MTQEKETTLTITRVNPADQPLWNLLKKVEADFQRLNEAFWADQDNGKKSLCAVRAINRLEESTGALKDAYRNLEMITQEPN